MSSQPNILNNYSLSADRLKTFQKKLAAKIEGEIRFDTVSRSMYSTDASVYQIIPLGVVIPRSADDVVHVVKICREFSVSITARGGGTSQAGQAVGHGIQLDFSKYLNRIHDIDPEKQTATVEPGIVLDNLNAELKRYGLYFPLDISTANRATIGGMIANNSAGTRSIIYGKTIDYVESMSVVLADETTTTFSQVTAEELKTKCAQNDFESGCYKAVRDLSESNREEIVKRYPNILRRVGGYNLDEFIHPEQSFNLARLMVGSEGTLGLIAETTLRIVPFLRHRIVCSIQFDDLLDALAAIPAILEHSPSAVELVDNIILSTTKGKIEFEPLRSFITGDPGAILIVELIAESADEARMHLDRFITDMHQHHIGTYTHQAVEQSEQARIWNLRQAALGLTMAETGDSKSISFVEDTAVSPENLHDYIAKFQTILKKYNTEAAYYAHASVGLLHVRPVVNMKTEAGISVFTRIAEEVSDLVLEYGGALSAEHGDGLSRSPFQKKMYGPILYDAFCTVKKTFDPENIFNPGKIVHSLPLTANLRFGSAYDTREHNTAFDFSDFGGITRAAEQCSGVGECRKSLAGTLCPSYMITRDETDVTRGRANTLRLALSGQLADIEFGDPELMPVFDLCLECKACKSECPTGVDVARLKSEYLHAYYKKHDVPKRVTLLTGIDRFTRIGSRFPAVSNIISQNRFTRFIFDSMFHIDARRSIPRFAQQAFMDWFHRISADKNTKGSSVTKTVAFFPDTFSNYFEPEHLQSAVNSAYKIGWNVHIPERICCGRPLISKGLLGEAVPQAEKVVLSLVSLANKNIPIVFCEPGCYSAVKDDIPKLVGNNFRDDSARVASACMTYEEWVLEAIKSNGKMHDNGKSTATPKEILLHGHCHQKALVGMEPTVHLLSQVPGSTITLLDSGCCGMAGSFGYEKEHYNISKAIGERVLFPAVRDQQPDTVIVAPGFSCRQQILHFTGVSAQSPAQIIASLWEDRQ